MALQDKYINPFTDFGFKKLFGSEPNKDLLIDFLNQVLPGKHKIKDLTYARTEQLGNSEADRKAIFDLYCVGENGERFIVEMPHFNKVETELQTNFDKWMYVLQQLPNLQNRPQGLQDKVFQKLFEAAEIAKFTPDEKQ
ncbi:MAG: PD-(D/E)XK nuclease family transposase [Saprospirales bacterium]|nr:PD-(D/E)XK nuclease family transposase [Saprospirales bacterium]